MQISKTQDQNIDSPNMENIQELVEKKKQQLSLQELQDIHEVVQNNNNAEISFKRKSKGPQGYHLQCIHFKSKKCPYRIRYLQEKNCGGQYLEDQYELEDHKLVHFNHKKYDEKNMIIIKSKQKIEKHRELIIEIYLKMIEDGQSRPKPTSIVKILKNIHKIDIYDGHAEKSIQDKLKKKLDNVIRDYKEGIKSHKKPISFKKGELQSKPQQQQLQVQQQQPMVQQQQEQQQQIQIENDDEEIPYIEESIDHTNNNMQYNDEEDWDKCLEIDGQYNIDSK